jgi:hypothetical protein
MNFSAKNPPHRQAEKRSAVLVKSIEQNKTILI